MKALTWALAILTVLLHLWEPSDALAQAPTKGEAPRQMVFVRSDHLLPGGKRIERSRGLLRLPGGCVLPAERREDARRTFAAGQRYYVWQDTEQQVTGQDHPEATFIQSGACAVAAPDVTIQPFAVVAKFAAAEQSFVGWHMYVCSPGNPEFPWNATSTEASTAPLSMSAASGQMLSGKGEVSMWLANAKPIGNWKEGDWKEGDLMPISNVARFTIEIERQPGSTQGGQPQSGLGTPLKVKLIPIESKQ